MRQYLFLSFVVMLVASASAYAASVTDIAAQANGKLSTKFLRTIDWNVAAKVMIQKVEYGHSSVGWFQTSRFVKQGDVLQVTLIPPTYKAPVTFRAIGVDGQPHTLGSKQFLSPLGEEFEHATPFIRSGTPAKPFLALTGALPYVNLSFTPPDSAPNAAFVYVINRLGEVVWVHFLDEGRTVVRQTLEMRRVGNGLAVYAPDEGIFEEVTLGGVVMRRVESKMLLPLAEWRPGFLVGREGLLVVGRQKFFQRNTDTPWSAPLAGHAPVLREVKGPMQQIVWRSLQHVWPATNDKGETKEKLVSLEVGPHGRHYFAMAPSNRLIVLDETRDSLVGVWKPRETDKSNAKILHVLPLRTHTYALYDDGSVWRCTIPCTDPFKKWAQVDAKQAWTRGRLVDVGQERLGVFGVRSLDHSFRRRRVKPDVYQELSMTSLKPAFRMEIPQNYHSPATSVVPLATLLGETWAASPRTGEQP